MIRGTVKRRYVIAAALSAAAVICLLSSGCVDNRKETEDRILSYDSSFQQSIDQRDSVQEELDSLKAAYIRKTQVIDSQIRELKRKKVEERTVYLDSMVKIRKKLSPRQEELQQELLDMQNGLRRRKMEMNDINRDMNEVNALVNKKDKLSLTREELQAWNKRLSMLLERQDETLKEIEKLKQDIEITALKLRVLKVR